MKFMGGCGGRVWGGGCGGRRVWEEEDVWGGGCGRGGCGRRRVWARKGDSLSSDIDDLSFLPYFLPPSSHQDFVNLASLIS